MLQQVSDGMTYLLSQSGASLFHLFWFVIIFEFPRYTLAFISVLAISFRGGRPEPPLHARRHTVSVVVAGHNEEDSIERCVRSLHEQSWQPNEIIVVSDGSTDRMPLKLRELQNKGLVQQVHCTQLRAGKSAAVNLALSQATCELVVNVDCDCTFDRKAIEEIQRPFADPSVGAVSGNIVVRNARSSLMASFQAIEYLISISQGKQAANLTDQMTCVSGAFGAFRRAAFIQAGGLDSGGGEDLDVTLTMRSEGWKTKFAPDAVCYTNVPTTLPGLTRQRFRWERDAIRLRYRKHRALMNPFSSRFSPRELLHELDFLTFNVVAAIAFPFYLVWLFATYGDLAPIILFGAQMGILVLDTFTFLLAAWLSPKVNSVALMPYLVGYNLYYGLIARFIRLAAYLQEWALEASYRDTYVPEKVHMVRR